MLLCPHYPRRKLDVKWFTSYTSYLLLAVEDSFFLSAAVVIIYVCQSGEHYQKQCQNFQRIHDNPLSVSEKGNRELSPYCLH